MKAQTAKATTYGKTARTFHWLMAWIWIASWCIGMLAAHVPALNPGHGLTLLHKALAACVLPLVVLRIAWRLTHPAPALPASMSRLMQRAAQLGHAVLYAVALLALPLSGWYWSSVGGRTVQLLGLVTLPPLAAANKELVGLAGSIHVFTAWFCGALVAGHLLIALKHHFVDRDGVLASMWPRAGKPR